MQSVTDGPGSGFYGQSFHYTDSFNSWGSLWEVRGEMGLSWSPATQRWMRFEVGYREDMFAWATYLWIGVRGFAFPGPFVRFEVGF
jgi:hypothetical protein